MDGNEFEKYTLRSHENSGCSTRPQHWFACVGTLLNIYRSNVTSVEGQLIEVLIRNGDTIAAVQIAPVAAGSNAVFYLGGPSAMFQKTAVKDFTKWCDQL